MTVPIETSQVSYTGNGIATGFSTVFKFFLSSHLVVELQLSGGAFAPKTLGVDYTVSAPDPTTGIGTVTMLVAPPSLSTLRITRTLPVIQSLALRTQGPFLPGPQEDEFDYLTEVCQMLLRRIAALEAGTASVTLSASKVTDGPFVCPDPQTARNVACAGTASMVIVGRIVDNTDGSLVQAGLGAPDLSAIALNQFTVRYLPGLTPGHSYTVTYLVLTL